MGVAIGWRWNCMLFKILHQVFAYFGLVDIIAVARKGLGCACLMAINLIGTIQQRIELSVVIPVHLGTNGGGADFVVFSSLYCIIEHLDEGPAGGLKHWAFVMNNVGLKKLVE